MKGGRLGDTLETQSTITAWADAVGITAEPVRAVMRAGEELHEAIADLQVGAVEDAGVELADVVICLFVAASKMGVDLQAEIDAKMSINRKRQWRVDETGSAYHVK